MACLLALNIQRLSGNNDIGCKCPGTDPFSDPFRQIELAILLKRSKKWPRPGTFSLRHIITRQPLNKIFGSCLGYVIPFIIIGFVAPGIADLGKSAGKLLGLTTGIAYLSTISGGTLAIIVGSMLLPGIIGGGTAENPEHALLATYLNVDIPPMMGVMTALITAFLLGLGMAAIGSRHMLGFMKWSLPTSPQSAPSLPRRPFR